MPLPKKKKKKKGNKIKLKIEILEFMSNISNENKLFEIE